VLVGGDHPHGEAVAEEVSAPAVPRVEPLRVAAVQDVHAVGELLPGGPKDQVVVGAQKAEGVHLPLEAPCHQHQQGEEVPPIVVLCEQFGLVDGSTGRVEEPIGEDTSEASCHEPTVALAVA
jgi:hypothetical protein